MQKYFFKLKGEFYGSEIYAKNKNDLRQKIRAFLGVKKLPNKIEKIGKN